MSPTAEAFNEPVLQEQYADNRRLRETTTVTLTYHYRYEPPKEALSEGASEVRWAAAVCAAADAPL